MNPVYDYDTLLFRLKKQFKEDYYAEDRRRVRMLGLCFARPTSPLAMKEIFPQIPDWHYRSGSHIDFYFAGFRDSRKVPNSLKVSMPGRGTWYYNPKVFDIFCKQVESRTKWKYSGGSDLILVNATYLVDTDETEIDFSGAIVCQLDAMKEAKSFSSVEQHFEAIFHFAEDSSDRDPTWGFSDRQAVSAGGSALQRIALSLLPAGLNAELEKLKHFAVKDIGR